MEERKDSEIIKDIKNEEADEQFEQPVIFKRFKKANTNDESDKPKV